jgi:protein required for attachment to host cells
MIVPNGTLIMVVDGARMLLYRNDGKALEPELTLVDSAADPSPQTAELGSDRPGRRFESVGTGRGAYEGPDYHQQAEDRFSHGAATRLNDLASQGEDSLILVAAPHVLGVIRPLLAPTTQEGMLASIAKDYTGHAPRDISEMLAKHET